MLTSRDKCLLTQNKEMEDLFILKNFPVFMGCVSELNSEEDIKLDMQWQINKMSGLIQLKNLVPLNVLYSQSHNSGGIGKIWNDHHQEFANFIALFKPTSILEIGGSHAVLYQKYVKNFGNLDWTIVDFNPVEDVKDLNLHFIKDEFNEEFNYENNFDILIHSHFFEHVYEPDKIMKKIASMLNDDRKMIFSIPNMEVMLKNKYSNCLNFEHTFLLTETYMEYLLSLYDIEIIKKKYFMDNHSIFYCVQKVNDLNKKALSPDFYFKNKKLFNNYIEYYQTLINKLNKDIKPNTYLFGAHIFSQNLINFGLDTEKIKNILDNDLNKQNKRLYGTNLTVESPLVLENVKNPEIILFTGAYNEEIKNQILKINNQAIFYEN